MRKTKKLLIHPLVLILILSLFNYHHFITASADEETEIRLTSEMTTLTTGRYYVSGRVTITERMVIDGNVTIYLRDSSHLYAQAGIAVLQRSTLTIDAQSNNDYHNSSLNIHKYAGRLTANGGYVSAGIGASDFGTDQLGWNLPHSNPQPCGNIIIDGGIITAIGNRYSAGIGGGFSHSSGRVVINEGNVTALGGTGSIVCSTFTMNGGSLSSDAYVDKYSDSYDDPGRIDCDSLSINSGIIYTNSIYGRSTTEIYGGTVTAENSISGTDITIHDGNISANQISPNRSYQKTANIIVNGGSIMVNDKILQYNVTINNGILTCSGFNDGSLFVNGGTFTSNGPINSKIPTLPAEYTYWTGMNADGSGAVRNSFPGTAFVNNKYNYIKIAGSTSLNPYANDLSTGTYSVKNNVEIAERIKINGDVILFLEDHSHLNAVKGINVPAGSSLTIDAQSDGADMGKLTATPIGEDIGTGIGGNEDEAAGSVIINGGDINVKGATFSSGIGRAYGGSGGSLTINGGRVKALPADKWLTWEMSGIHVDTLTITGGIVEAAGGVRGNVGIPVDPGGGRPDLGYPPGYVSYSKQSAIRADSITLPSTYSYWIGDDRDGSNAVRRSYPATAFVNDTQIRYFKLEPYDPSQDTPPPVTLMTGSMTELTSGDYLVEGDLNVSGRITVNGDVNITLAEDAHLNAAEGINVAGSNSLTIDAPESAGITATGGNTYAGIGGRNNESAGNITINGGEIRATGGAHASGIGGGYTGSGGEIVINDGEITAIGGRNSAGIGGGAYGQGGTITINGGTVTAIGDNEYAAAIGGGWSGSGGTININGGIVIAEGGANCAGIGDGMSGSGAVLTVSGGTITASGIVAIRADITSLPDRFTFWTSADMDGQGAVENTYPEAEFLNDSSFKFIQLDNSESLDY